jgi:hypothetical protein
MGAPPRGGAPCVTTTVMRAVLQGRLLCVNSSAACCWRAAPCEPARSSQTNKHSAPPSVPVAAAGQRPGCTCCYAQRACCDCCWCGCFCSCSAAAHRCISGGHPIRMCALHVHRECALHCHGAAVGSERCEYPERHSRAAWTHAMQPQHRFMAAAFQRMNTRVTLLGFSWVCAECGAAGRCTLWLLSSAGGRPQITALGCAWSGWCGGAACDTPKKC